VDGSRDGRGAPCAHLTPSELSVTQHCQPELNRAWKQRLRRLWISRKNIPNCSDKPPYCTVLVFGGQSVMMALPKKVLPNARGSFLYTLSPAPYIQYTLLYSLCMAVAAPAILIFVPLRFEHCVDCRLSGRVSSGSVVSCVSGSFVYYTTSY
jgi:hypothetical protein